MVKPNIRIVLRKIQKGKCFFCQTKMTPPLKGSQFNTGDVLPDNMETLEHLLPKKYGGRNDGNRVLSCNACNNKKGHHSSFEYLGLKWMRYMFADASRKRPYYSEYKIKIPF